MAKNPPLITEPTPIAIVDLATFISAKLLLLKNKTTLSAIKPLIIFNNKVKLSFTIITALPNFSTDTANTIPIFLPTLSIFSAFFSKNLSNSPNCVLIPQKNQLLK